jgi:hypothetical protein
MPRSSKKFFLLLKKKIRTFAANSFTELFKCAAALKYSKIQAFGASPIAECEALCRPAPLRAPRPPRRPMKKNQKVQY